METNSDKISAAMRRAARMQNSSPASQHGLSNPIAGGLGRISNISQANNSQANQRGFSDMLAAFQLMRQMPDLSGGDINGILSQRRQTTAEVAADIPEPLIDPRFNVEPDPDPEPDPEDLD